MQHTATQRAPKLAANAHEFSHQVAPPSPANAPRVRVDAFRSRGGIRAGFEGPQGPSKSHMDVSYDVPIDPDQFYPALHQVYNRLGATYPLQQVQAGGPLDLHLLCRFVAAEGGSATMDARFVDLAFWLCVDRVHNATHSRWQSVARAMHNTASNVEEAFYRYLYPYEQHLVAEADFRRRPCTCVGVPCLIDLQFTLSHPVTAPPTGDTLHQSQATTSLSGLRTICVTYMDGVALPTPEEVRGLKIF